MNRKVQIHVCFFINSFPLYNSSVTITIILNVNTLISILLCIFTIYFIYFPSSAKAVSDYIFAKFENGCSKRSFCFSVFL